MHKLPSYRPESFTARQNDFKNIFTADSIDSLSQIIYNCTANNLSHSVINKYVDSEYFNSNADFKATPEAKEAITRVIYKLHSIVIAHGFPYSLKTRDFQIDITLSKVLIEVLEYVKFSIHPGESNLPNLQVFITQRVFPLITYWRWNNKGKINEDRIKCSNRNYFYTLWLAGWLFDRGFGEANRWELLEQMTADSLVAIIERPGIGLRKGFVQAVSKELMRRRSAANNPTLNLDILVRGAMKRATYTFATSIMLDENSYYDSIVQYLFKWAELNYKKVDLSQAQLDVSEEPVIVTTYGNQNTDELESKTNLNSFGLDVNTSFAKSDLENDNEEDENEDEEFSLPINSKYYIKKLTGNELGYRNGEPKTGQMFYISKQAVLFFPPLRTDIKNDSAELEIIADYRKAPTKVTLVFHNDKFNSEGGTRDEYRIYLNKDLAPYDSFFKPDDIILMTRTGFKKYFLNHYRNGSPVYRKLNMVIEASEIRGNHALTDKNPLK